MLVPELIGRPYGEAKALGASPSYTQAPSSLHCLDNIEIFESAITQEACTFGGASAQYTGLERNFECSPKPVGCGCGRRATISGGNQIVGTGQVVEWQASKHVITQMLLEYDTQILTQID